MKYLSKLTCLFAFLCLFSTESKAQLTSDSLSFTVIYDSLSVPSQLWLEATFDDISDVGGVEISAYDAVTGHFIKEYQGTRAELISAGYLTTTHLYFQLLDIIEGQQYRVQMNAYNVNGAYIETKEITTSL